MEGHVDGEELASLTLTATLMRFWNLDSDEMARLLGSVEHVIVEYAEERVPPLARSVRLQLSKMKASGAWAIAFKTVWDEYCYEIQEGPTPLRSAFDLTVNPYLDQALARLSGPEATLVSFAAKVGDPSVDLGDTVNCGLGVAPDDLRQLLRHALDELAINRALDRFFR